MQRCVEKKSPVCHKHISPELLKALQGARGCRVRKVPGENLRCFDMRAGSPGHRILIAWADDEDPGVQILFAPPRPGIVLPAAANLMAILKEAASILHHMAQLKSANFSLGAPPMPPPLLAIPFMPINVSNAKMALQTIPARIQQPPHGYAGLQAEAAGTYLCSVEFTYARAQFLVHLYKA